MFYELFVITASALGVTIFLIYFLAIQIAGRIPTAEDMVEAAVAEFGLQDSSPSGGGRKAEGWAGMVETFLASPVGQSLAQKFLSGMGGGTGGMTNYGP